MNMDFKGTLLRTIKEKGQLDGETMLLYAPDNLFMRKSGRKWDLLYVGIFKTNVGDEVPQFLFIEVDSQGKDTTTEQFFDWEELREELRVNIRAWIDKLNK